MATTRTREPAATPTKSVPADTDTRVSLLESENRRINARLEGIETALSKHADDMHKALADIGDQLRARTSTTWREIDLALGIVQRVGLIVAMTVAAIVYVSSNIDGVAMAELRHQIEIVKLEQRRERTLK